MCGTIVRKIGRIPWIDQKVDVEDDEIMNFLITLCDYDTRIRHPLNWYSNVYQTIDTYYKKVISIMPRTKHQPRFTAYDSNRHRCKIASFDYF